MAGRRITGVKGGRVRFWGRAAFGAVGRTGLVGFRAGPKVAHTTSGVVAARIRSFSVADPVGRFGRVPWGSVWSVYWGTGFGVLGN